METDRLTRIKVGFYVCLLPVFFVQLWLSGQKLRSGQIGTVISRIKNPTLRMPVINVCNDGKRVWGSPNDTMASMYDQIKDVEVVTRAAYKPTQAGTCRCQLFH